MYRKLYGMGRLVVPVRHLICLSGSQLWSLYSGAEALCCALVALAAIVPSGLLLNSAFPRYAIGERHDNRRLLVLGDQWSVRSARGKRGVGTSIAFSINTSLWIGGVLSAGAGQPYHRLTQGVLTLGGAPETHKADQSRPGIIASTA